MYVVELTRRKIYVVVTYSGFGDFVIFLLHYRQLSNLKLLSVPSIDIISANPNLEFLNLALDIDFGDLQVAGNFEVVSKKTLAEIPITSSGEFM
jgi:hypothetical protein